MRSPLLARLAVAITLALATAATADTPPIPTCGAAGALAREIDGMVPSDPTKSAHPLIGKALFVARPDLQSCWLDDVVAHIVEAAGTSTRPAILLGEVHDNPRHHRLRAAIIDRIASAAREKGVQSPALVFEHIRTDQAPQLGKASFVSAGEVLTALNWSTSGWPDQSMFMPLFESAVKWRLPLLAGHPAASAVRDVSRKGFDALASDERTRLALDKPLPDKLQDDLLGDLEASHCGLMAKTAFANMAAAQRYRDAHMADVVATLAKERTTILLAGNGHVRTDRGVPYYLANRSQAYVSVLLLEVEDGKSDPAAYGPFAADAIIFTARAERKDPCEEMRAMMQKKK